MLTLNLLQLMQMAKGEQMTTVKMMSQHTTLAAQMPKGQGLKVGWPQLHNPQMPSQFSPELTRACMASMQHHTTIN